MFRIRELNHDLTHSPANNHPGDHEAREPLNKSARSACRLVQRFPRQAFS